MTLATQGYSPSSFFFYLFFLFPVHFFLQAVFLLHTSASPSSPSSCRFLDSSRFRFSFVIFYFVILSLSLLPSTLFSFFVSHSFSFPHLSSFFSSSPHLVFFPLYFFSSYSSSFPLLFISFSYSPPLPSLAPLLTVPQG